MLLTISQILIFVIYLTFIVKKFGVLASISDSWYKLKTINLEFLFTLFCWSIGFMMFFQGDNPSGWFFFSGAGLIFVGTATQFKMSGAATNIVHYTGAILCILCAMLGVGLGYNIWIPSIVAVILAAILCLVLNRKHLIWWLEILAFSCICLELILINI